MKSLPSLQVQQVAPNEDGVGYHLVNLRVQSLEATEESPYLHLSLNENWQCGLMVFYESAEEGTMIASASPVGSGRLRGGYVLTAACAIAVARHSNSTISNHTHDWGSQFDYEPEQLLNLLQCQQPHISLEEAVDEILHNVKQAKARGE